MKILLVMPTRETFSRNFIQVLLRRGHKVIVFGTEIISFPSAGLNFRFYPFPQKLKMKSKFRTLNYLIRFINLIMYFTSFLQLKTVTLKENPDVINYHWIDSKGILLSLLFRNRLIYSGWGSDINDLYMRRKNDIYKKILTYSMKKATFVTCDSIDQMEKLGEIMGSENKIELAYFGIDVNKFENVASNDLSNFQKKYLINEDYFVITSIRALKRNYFHECIIEAVSQFQDNHPSEKILLILKLHFAMDKDYLRFLQSKVKEKQILNVLWIDSLSDDEMPLLYKASNVVVSFPANDGFPVSFFEAGICRVPMISSSLDAYGEIMENGLFYFTKSGDIIDLYEKLEESFDDIKFGRMGKIYNAYNYMKEHGDQSTTIQKWEKLYGSL